MVGQPTLNYQPNANVGLMLEKRPWIYIFSIWHWSYVANGCKRWRQFANIGPIMTMGKWLASRHCTANLTQMLVQCWKCDHKLRFFTNCWRMVGKGLASQHHNANLMPTLGQCWKSDHLLLFPKNGWQMVGNWSDSQRLMLRLAQCWLANQ